MSKDDDEYPAVSYFPDDSQSDDEESERDSNGRTFLKYKTKVKKNFKPPKLDRLQQQIIKVGQTLLDQKNRKYKQEQSLSTPSQLVAAPSDFEHVFHAKRSDTQELRESVIKEEERKEQELLKKIFQNQCKIKDVMIPIYTVDESSIPRVVNVALSKLNQMNKQFAQKSLPTKIFPKKIQPIFAKQNAKLTSPKMKTITNVKATSKDQTNFKKETVSSSKLLKKDVKK